MTAVVTMLSVGIIVPAVVIGSLYLDLTLAAALAWFGSVVVALVVGASLVVRLLRGRLAPIRRWAADDEADPAAAWTALVEIPALIGVRTCSVLVPLNVAVSGPVLVRLAEPSVQGLVGLAYAYGLVGLASAVLATSVLQLGVRTAASDIGARLAPVEQRLAGWWTIRRRLALSTFVAASLNGVASPLLVAGTATTEADYLMSLVGGGLLAGYLVWLLDLGIFQPTVTPVQDLIAGTARVRRGTLGEAVPVSTLDELGDLGAAFNEMQVGLRDRAALQAAFGSYVDPALAQRLIDSGSSVFEGEELEVSVLFADVRGFTSYSEGVTPADAVALLNRLFDVIVPVVHAHGGHANHYLGDGLLAVFGAPQPVERHADAAVAAAIEIQRRVRAAMGVALRIGIGINTGPVIAGTVGGGGRLEFTVIGDTVNVAARVEALTKETGDPILITEATRRALAAPRPRSAKRGEFAVRGKASTLTLHAVNPFPRSARSST